MNSAPVTQKVRTVPIKPFRRRLSGKRSELFENLLITVFSSLRRLVLYRPERVREIFKRLVAFLTAKTAEFLKKTRTSQLPLIKQIGNREDSPQNFQNSFNGNSTEERWEYRLFSEQSVYHIYDNHGTSFTKFHFMAHCCGLWNSNDFIDFHFYTQKAPLII